MFVLPSCSIKLDLGEVSWWNKKGALVLGSESRLHSLAPSLTGREDESLTSCAK